MSLEEKNRMKIKGILSIALLIFVCGCSKGEHPATTQRDENAKMERDIPPLFQNPKDLFGLDALTDSVGIQKLREKLLSDPSAIEVRFWVFYGPPSYDAKCYIFERVDSQWTGRYLTGRYYDPVNPFMAVLSEPSCGWEEFWKRLETDGIFILPDSSELANPAMIIDGYSYIVEILTYEKYRLYHYGNPDQQKWPEAKQIEKISKIIWDELDVPERPDKE